MFHKTANNAKLPKGFQMLSWS